MKGLFKTEALNYALLGMLLGCCFPIVGTFIEARSYGSSGFPQFVVAQKNSPLLWIIDTAPVFLGLSAYFIGNRIDALRLKNREMLQAQKQLVLQEQMASIGMMTAGIAHEIKNPLNFVINFAEGSEELIQALIDELELHREKFKTTEFVYIQALISDLQKNAIDIKRNGARATRIVFTLMDLTRGGEGIDKAIDLHSLIDENVDLAYHGYRANYPNFSISIQKRYDPLLPLLWLNTNGLGRVLLNILDNACYALYQKQKVNIEHFTPTLTISTASDQNQLQIDIMDNGSGIPQELSDKIFEPFFSTKPSGEGNTGLGLSLSKDIIEKEYKGRIIFEGIAGQSSRFIIQLPMPLAKPE